MRRKIVAGNWKLHGSRTDNAQLIDALVAGFNAVAGVDCVVCPPFVYLQEIARLLHGSSLGLGALAIVSPEQLISKTDNSGAVPYINQGNTRINLAPYLGAPAYNFTPVIADASVTYTLTSFPLYNGAFPLKLAGEAMNNPGAPKNNNGYWVGVTFGKSGTRKTWDLSYRYEYLEADAWYDQMVDDDNGAFYQNAAPGGGSANTYYGSTNVKGHLVKFTYSITDSLSISTTCFINDLINQNLYGKPAGAVVTEPNNSAMHFMADLMWKF